MLFVLRWFSRSRWAFDLYTCVSSLGSVTSFHCQIYLNEACVRNGEWNAQRRSENAQAIKMKRDVPAWGICKVYLYVQNVAKTGLESVPIILIAISRPYYRRYISQVDAPLPLAYIHRDGDAPSANEGVYAHATSDFQWNFTLRDRAQRESAVRAKQQSLLRCRVSNVHVWTERLVYTAGDLPWWDQFLQDYI